VSLEHQEISPAGPAAQDPLGVFLEDLQGRAVALARRQGDPVFGHGRQGDEGPLLEVEGLAVPAQAEPPLVPLVVIGGDDAPGRDLALDLDGGRFQGELDLLVVLGVGEIAKGQALRDADIYQWRYPAFLLLFCCCAASRARFKALRS